MDQGRGLHSVLDLELFKDILDVVLDREGADEEHISDFMVGLTRRDPAQDIVLAQTEGGRQIALARDRLVGMRNAHQ